VKRIGFTDEYLAIVGTRRQLVWYPIALVAAVAVEVALLWWLA